MQQISDAASVIFGSDKSTVKALVQIIVFCRQYAFQDLPRSLPACVDMVFESLRDWF